MPTRIGNLAESCALGLGTVLAAPLRLEEVLLEIATSGLVIPDQSVDPLMTDADAGQGRQEIAVLLRTPLFVQPVGDGGDHTGQALRPLPGGAAAVITESLGLLGIVATKGGVPAQLTTDRTAVEPQLSANPALLMPKS